MVRVSLQEVRRLLARLFHARPSSAEMFLHWLNWRAAHQSLARYFHFKRRKALGYLQL